MKKSEIKDGIKSIMDSINTAKENIEEYLQPYEEIKNHLDEIQSIEEENGIETGLDYEMVANDTLRSCIEQSGDIEDITNQFDYLISDLESWQSEVSENKSEKIQEDYIDIITEIKDNFELDSIECSEDLENQLCDMSQALNNVIV
jgi:chromosome segregation ATPase